MSTRLLYNDVSPMQPVLEASERERVVTYRSANWTSLGLFVLALGLLWFVCCRYLSAEWSFNEQYNYGWFVPLFAAYLFWLRWVDKPEVDVGSKVGRRVAVLLIIASALILLPLRVFEIGSGEWRPLGWLHVTAVATITLALIYLVGGKNWLRHFSFPVLFFFIAVPWITAIETPVVQGFMRIIAASAAETLGLFGIPVEVQGNLLRVPNGVVGVSEACSGVRSFQTSLMIGLLFGELNRLSVRSRFLLIGGAVAIGLVANFFRAALLVWIASREGLAAVTRWHDFAGYAIVLIVFAGTMWLASRWKSSSNLPARNATHNVAGGHSSNPPTLHSSNSGTLLGPPWPFAALLLWLIAIEAGAEFWYRAHERDLIARPSWSVQWPQNAPGYHEIKIDPEVRNMLRFNSGREVAWTSKTVGSSAAPAMFSYLFFFRWDPGSGTILRARAHRPDICLPAAGWKQVGTDRLESFQIGTNLSLPFRRFDFVKETSSGLALHAVAFFTLHEDVSHQSERANDDNAGFYSNWDWADRWRVVRNGIRNRGQQVFEMIMIEPEVNQAAVEQEFAAAVPKLIAPSP